jgi:hypothetical protein
LTPNKQRGVAILINGAFLPRPYLKSPHDCQTLLSVLLLIFFTQFFWIALEFYVQHIVPALYIYIHMRVIINVCVEQTNKLQNPFWCTYYVRRAPMPSPLGGGTGGKFSIVEDPDLKLTRS